MQQYILIEVAENGTFFKSEDLSTRYFEIYKLGEKQVPEINDLSSTDKSTIIVHANNQLEALKKFIEIHGNIYKMNNKQYYERSLPLKV